MGKFNEMILVKIGKITISEYMSIVKEDQPVTFLWMLMIIDTGLVEFIEWAT